MSRRTRQIGVPTRVVGPSEVAELVPGIVTDDIVAAAYEPESGYADPVGTAAGFIAAARRDWRLALSRAAGSTGVTVDGGHVTGVETDQGTFAAGAVVDVAGAWAATVAQTVGLDDPGPAVAPRHGLLRRSGGPPDRLSDRHR